MPSTVLAFVVPELDEDKHYGDKLSGEARLQRRLVAGFLNYMEAAGWKVSHVYDTEEMLEVTDIKSAMEVIFSVDYTDLTFTNADGNTHGVRLIPSNVWDMIVDWSFSESDADQFNVVMSAFDMESLV